MAAAGKTCGECTLCCWAFEIPPLAKPSHAWCPHVLASGGCGVYADRPEPCRAFECGYLQNPALGPEWRPDQAGFLMYFTTPGPRLNIIVDERQPDGWRREPYLAQLRDWARRDRGTVVEIAVRSGGELTILFPEGEVALGRDTGRPVRSGYRIEHGRPTPFAEFA